MFAARFFGPRYFGLMYFGEVGAAGEVSQMSIFNKYSHLDRALMARQIEAAHGSPIFDRYSLLDDALFDRQVSAAFDLHLSLAALLDADRELAEIDAAI